MSGDEVALRLQKAAAVYAAKSRSDLNFQIPPVDTDATGRKYFETAPVPLKRLLGSPLDRRGKYAQGPNKERVISSGWGRPRVRHLKERNVRTSHKGLDFRSFLGEKVYACADGRVTFAGLSMLKSGGLDVPGIYADAVTRDVFNADGIVIATDAQIGDAGIYITVQHTGDFEGYRTEYMHLGKTYVDKDDRVEEGQLIGEIGNTAVRRAAVHLHFQVNFVAGRSKALVNPTSLVPNYWPGHDDSTTTATTMGIQDLGEQRPAGAGVVFQGAAGTIQTLDRATNLQNQGGADHKRLQSAHRDLIVRNLNAQQSQLYSAIAQFGGNPPVVTDPMTFDFTTGLWSDGKAV
jgi:murein DD-endopeptidase MepM/ murein hydrolase activator NlpD